MYFSDPSLRTYLECHRVTLYHSNGLTWSCVQPDGLKHCLYLIHLIVIKDQLENNLSEKLLKVKQIRPLSHNEIQLKHP